MARHTDGDLLAWVIAAALMFLTSVGSASAQEAKEKPPPAQQAKRQETPQEPAGWSVRCDNAGQGLACKATQSIVLAKTRQLLLSVAVSKPAAGKNGAMLLQLPYGLFNPAGVAVRVDDGKFDMLQIQTCDGKGCYAGAPLTPETLAAMTKGTKLNVIFQDLKKQKITVPVPLKGFEEAFKKL